MALSFPNSPSVGDVHEDSASGFSYQWSGELWKSYKVNTDSLGGNLDADLTLNSNDITGTGDVREPELVLHHLLGLLPLLSPSVGHGLHLLLQVTGNLFSAQRLITANIDLLENIDRSVAYILPMARYKK